MLRKLPNFILLICSVGIFSGCGNNNPVTVEGIFTVDGKSVVLKKTATVQITFHPDPVDPKNTRSYPADFDNETLSYKIPSIPKGKYKVEVSYLDPYPVRDKLNGAYSSNKTTIKCELNKNMEFNINVSTIK
jgi:hypothetical protein